MHRDGRVVAVGRNRDYNTFIRAISGTKIPATIIAGASDAQSIVIENDAIVEVRIEVPFQEYRAAIRHAGMCVIPIGTDMVRSLGQIALLEAVAAKTPVIAARVSQLTDYFENEILFYRAGDFEDLRGRLQQALASKEANIERTEAAFARMIRDYTSDRYTRKLLQLCESFG